MIQPIEEIPNTPVGKRVSYRDMIRRDLKEAIESGIRKFEFVGDGYNYKYLANYAREEARMITHRTLRSMWAEERERARAAGDYIYPDEFRCRSYIVIHSRRESDRIHVYCEINPEYLKEYAEAELKRALADLEKRKSKRGANHE